jgi:hypothetical protein
MTQSSLHIIAPTLQIVPLALAVASRLLLTEKSSAIIHPRLAAVPVDSPPTVSLRPTHGYDHFGIND